MVGANSFLWNWRIVNWNFKKKNQWHWAQFRDFHWRKCTWNVRWSNSAFPNFRPMRLGNFFVYGQSVQCRWKKCYKLSQMCIRMIFKFGSICRVVLVDNVTFNFLIHHLIVDVLMSKDLTGGKSPGPLLPLTKAYTMYWSTEVLKTHPFADFGRKKPTPFSTEIVDFEAQ